MTEVTEPAGSMPYPNASSGGHASDFARGPAATTVWERLSFGIVHSLVSLLLAVIGLRGLYRLGRAFGTMEWLMNHRRRHRFARALGQVSEGGLDRSEVRAATREYFMCARCDKLFYLIFDRIDQTHARDLFSIRNEELLQQASSRGRGVYVALSHHGAHHIAGMLMTLRGYKVAGVRDRQEGGLRRFVQDRFDRRYPEFGRARILYSDSYPREIYRCFEEGFILGSAMDVSRVRHPNQKTEEVMVFGERRPFVSGPLRIALRCRAPALQAFILAHDHFHYELDIVGELLDPEHVTDEEESIRRALDVYARNVERYVRAYPRQLTRI
jgi:lauroyl/myristoyl acyltransferase